MSMLYFILISKQLAICYEVQFLIKLGVCQPVWYMPDFLKWLLSVRLVCACVHAYVRVCVCVYMYACVYVYIHACMFTREAIYNYLCKIVHKQMYWIRTNLRKCQPSNVFVTFECL